LASVIDVFKQLYVLALSEPFVSVVSAGFDSMQARLYSVGVTKALSSDKYAVLAGVDTAATAINWDGHTNTTWQSGEWRYEMAEQ